ncbi:MULTISPECIES: T9SS type A sorting domain-containing protein [unclassified Chryseobacterium]|uniref:DUF7619 domain-containing protein n=1 Tax=unclassified Chryseobacterium TaxID=2593645 RepID=UPI00226A7CFD|nr:MULTISPECIES: T9SS type A sorting domain-containing protein [unclassified Chryseobacterium]
MKKIYLFSFILMLSVLHAQIINIPDANLKAKLLSNGATYNSAGNIINVDTNNDGEIQLTEAQLVNKIVINMNNSITNFNGLENFPVLKELQIINPNLPNSTTTFSNYPALQKFKISGGTMGNIGIENINSLLTIEILAWSSSLNIQNTSVQEISYEGNLNLLNITSSPDVKKFKLGNTQISSLNLTNLPILEDVNITQNSSLSHINFTGSTALKKIVVANNHLSTLTIPNPSIVNHLDITGNIFQSFDPTIYPSILNFFASGNQLTSLNFSSNPLLYQLFISENQLSTLTFNNNAGLQYIYAGNNQLQNIDFTQIPFVKNIQIHNNLFNTIDFTKNFSLLTFDCSNNPNLQVLLMKNGIDNYSGMGSYGFANTPQLKYICIDPEEIYMLNALLYQYNQTNVVVNTYCTFTPGGISYLTEGVTRYDADGNGCDNGDALKPFQKFNILNNTGWGTAISDATGAYKMYLSPGTNVVSPLLENPSYFIVSPSSVNINFPNQAAPFIQNFCLTANGTHNDLETVIIPVTIARPGFESKYKIIYKNKGTTTQSGNLSFNYNDNVVNYLSATNAPTSQSSGLLNWNFTNLLPFETREITVTVTLNTPTQTPALNGGDILHYTAQINGATDDTLLDNTFTLNQMVVNSFDPNDKTCLEGTSITQAKVGDYVHYLIRFENTGTANAQNIVVKDDIDINKYDLSSLVALNGSHSFVTRLNGNSIEFIFENIQLPFDDANNDGYVSFKIKTKSTLNIGDSFSNSAKIYFDYNHPIITNTYTTTVQNVLATSEISKNNDTFTIYPNPVKDILHFKSKTEIVKAEIYDATGRIITSANVKENSINISELSKGNYIIKAFTKDKTFTQKLIKN